jgi:hypothetical protein
MTGRPTISGPSKSVRLLELEATSKANSCQASQMRSGGNGYGVESGERLWAGRCVINNSGHPGLDSCSGVLGFERREWTAEILGDWKLPWHSA